MLIMKIDKQINVMQRVKLNEIALSELEDD